MSLNSFEQLIQKTKEIENVLGVHFNDSNLLMQAFTHSSFVNEYRLGKPHNERLEFLGDAVLGNIVAKFLFLRLNDATEGQLSILKAAMIEAASCEKYLKILKLDKFLLLGKGEKKEKIRHSILANAFEAVIGAIFLDQGFDAVQKFFLDNFAKELEEILLHPVRNYKAELQDVFQRKYQKIPQYKVLEEHGPPHERIFLVAVFFEEKELARGVGNTKKEAEYNAAKEAMKNIPNEFLI